MYALADGECRVGHALGCPVQEVHYPDGKSERVYIDGRRSVCFANGTRKETLSPQNGGGAVVFFINGDLKRSYPNHLRVDYYYSEVDTVGVLSHCP